MEKRRRGRGGKERKIEGKAEKRKVGKESKRDKRKDGLGGKEREVKAKGERRKSLKESRNRRRKTIRKVERDS